MIDAVPPAAPTHVEALTFCGVQKSDISIVYDDVIETYIVTIASKSEVTSDRFSCIRNQAWAKFEVRFEKTETEKIYRDFSTDMDKAEGKAMAIAWLKTSGLYARLPRLTDSDNAKSVIAKINRFCKTEPRRGLSQAGKTLITISQELSADVMADYPGSQQLFACLLYTTSALDLTRYGLKFGFIGNEATAVPDKTTNAQTH